ncbi:hypothetical protein GCM10020369_31230 [Cryptosporangium minutisporangium]|uniref:Uncharacterized protein n=1 Tax=Cryptosporangium minutisporangium TaxID=113569 RepID=A0ABP6SYP4_9ACTN
MTASGRLRPDASSRLAGGSGYPHNEARIVHPGTFGDRRHRHTGDTDNEGRPGGRPRTQRRPRPAAPGELPARRPDARAQSRRGARGAPGRLVGTYPAPRVVRLVTYVVTRWRYSRGPCSSRKGDRTPSEARMPLRITPAAPTWAALGM